MKLAIRQLAKQINACSESAEELKSEFEYSPAHSQHTAKLEEACRKLAEAKSILDSIHDKI